MARYKDISRSWKLEESDQCSVFSDQWYSVKSSVALCENSAFFAVKRKEDINAKNTEKKQRAQREIQKVELDRGHFSSSQEEYAAELWEVVLQPATSNQQPATQKIKTLTARSSKHAACYDKIKPFLPDLLEYGSSLFLWGDARRTEGDGTFTNTLKRRSAYET